MRFIPTSVPDVVMIEPDLFGDNRGFFMQVFHGKEFSKHGIADCFVQDNHSGSRKNTLRGIHYQIHQAQGKLVRVIQGEIYDVAVDLRRSSPTFGAWVGVKLAASNKNQLWVPPGFGHGFLVVSEWAEVLYKTTDYYAPEWERAIAWNDPRLAISWPLLPGDFPLLSAKDQQGKPFADAELYD